MYDDHDAMPTLASWSSHAAGTVWAPEVAYIQGQFVMYYNDEAASTGGLCVGIATSSLAGGPYTPTNASQPLICAPGDPGVIDPFPFEVCA